MVGLACKIDAGGPAYTNDAIPISTQAAGSLEDTVRDSIKSGSENSVIAFTLDESQVTSYLTYKLDQSEKPFLQDIQIELRDGFITLYGKSDQGVITSSVMVKIFPRVNEDGNVNLDITTVDAGPFQAPQTFLDKISKELNNLLNNQFSPVSDHFKVKTIYIADGMITIGGEVQADSQNN
jgi:uncharacterized protein YpmS